MAQRLLFLLFFICQFSYSSLAQLTCPDYTLSGSLTSPYYMSQGSSTCTASPIPSPNVYWTGVNTNGYIKHTFTNPLTDVQIWYTIINTDDIASISINGGGTLTLSVVSGCCNASGNILGPYTGGGLYGDALVRIRSTQPFTEVTLVNIGGSSGQCTGACNSVIFPDACSFDLGPDISLCQGESVTLDVTEANATYLWQDNSTQSTLHVTQSGEYWVKRTVNGCIDSDTIMVYFNYTPQVNLGADGFICMGESRILTTATSRATYLWQDNSTQSTFEATAGGTYWVEVTVGDCSAADTINLALEDCEVILVMPNLFTTNQDGMNDLFTPIQSKGIVTMHTTIHNSWGQKVFDTDNPLIEWSGINASDGMYYWMITYTDKRGNELNQKGWVHLVK